MEDLNLTFQRKDIYILCIQPFLWNVASFHSDNNKQLAHHTHVLLLCNFTPNAPISL